MARNDGEIPAVGVRVEHVEQRTREDVADDGEHFDVLARDGVPDHLGVEALAVDEDDGAATGQCRQRCEQPGAVHQRRRR